jgi:hypothetical protein
MQKDYIFIKITEKMESYNNLQRKINQLQQENRNLKDENKRYKILRANNNITRLGTSRTSKFEHKQRIKQILTLFNSELKTCNFMFDSVVITNSSSSEDTAFNLKFSSVTAPVTEDIVSIKPDVDKCIYYKDKITMADHKYHAFKNGMKLKTQMASLKAIRKRKDEISTYIEMTEFSTGFYLNPIKMIKLRISKFLKSLNNENLAINNQIRIKLSCDGTQLSRNVTIVNLVFSIINEQKKAATAAGNYRIGIFRIVKENFETINQWLPHIWQPIKSLKNLTFLKTNDILLEDSELQIFRETNNFNERDVYRFKIEYLFSGDYKMILLVLGLKSASSKNPCFLCEISESDNSGLNGIGDIFFVKKVIK